MPGLTPPALLMVNQSFSAESMVLSRGFICVFVMGYKRIVHPQSADEGTEPTWFELKERPRKRAPKDQSIKRVHQAMASNFRKG